ncbi:MAG: M81 family metallopeptidase [Thalassobaculales bacterium]
MRLFAASLATETNTFSPLPTSLQSYTDVLYYRPGEHPEERPALCTGPLWVARRRARAEGWTLVEGSCFWAEPAGRTAKAAYERMRDEILGQLQAALPVDGVVLGLHGAMVAHGYDDCEGDLIERVRALVGPKAVIGVELDPHCHMTAKRLAHADILICFKEFPHTDFAERAEEVVDLTLRAIRGEIRPVKAVYDCRMIGSFPTTLEPMRSFVDKIKAMEGRNGVLTISLGHCFPYADVPEIGAKVLVITDGDKAAAERLAVELGQEFVAMRGKSMPPFLSPEQAIERAVRSNEGPVVIADPADNAGGGAASDATEVLEKMLAAGVEDAAFAPMWDPVAVRLCFDAGEGATFALRFGGKTAPTSGRPIDAEVTVTKLVEDAWQSFGPGRVPLGDCAAIRVGGVEVVLITKRTQALGLELFTNLGIDPAKKKIVVVKSTNHFHAAYAPIAAQVLYIDSSGPLPRDHRKVPYTRIQRPIWPIDAVAEPFLVRT